MSDHQHIVFDDTAMVAAGRGSQIASRLIHRAHTNAGLRSISSTSICQPHWPLRGRPRGRSPTLGTQSRRLSIARMGHSLPLQILHGGLVSRCG